MTKADHELSQHEADVLAFEDWTQIGHDIVKPGYSEARTKIENKPVQKDQSKQ